MYPRFITDAVRTALADTRVVFIAGPRQAGKTTLLRALAPENRPYLTLDDETTLRAAKDDPRGFIRGLSSAAIDEVQRAPDLLLSIKESVDADPRPGRFLLTGSANVMALPRVADSLAGRMGVLPLLPLSRAEIFGRPPSFLSLAFQGQVAPAVGAAVGDDLIDLVLAGGYPEALARPSVDRRHRWCLDYLDAIVQRDVRDVAEVGRLGEMPRLLRLLAMHSGRLVNSAEIGAPLGIDRKTAQRYTDILEALFLVATVPAWSSNQIKRLIKAPKLHFLDSGLLAALLGIDAARIKADRSLLGPLLETFVYGELAKQVGWSDKRIGFFHFRTKEGREVDLVMEDRFGRVVGIEVKASATVRPSDFGGVRRLADACGDRFALGAVCYDGDTAVPFGPNLWAIPVSNLWQ